MQADESKAQLMNQAMAGTKIQPIVEHKELHDGIGDGEEQSRVIGVNDAAVNSAYVDNYVRTSKYTKLNFVPKNLFEQFRRVANVYFLIISILQLSTDLSPTNEYATALPLTLVLIVTMVKEGVEDKRRHEADERINRAKARVLVGDKFVTKEWQEILVGDIVRVENREQVPADIIILSSSEPQGVCYIETANLDGETNLKLRQALDETQRHDAPDELSKLKGTVTCELPNTDLYTFDGSINLGGEDVPINVDEVVWRGCMLRNTGHIHGLVVFTGEDTKAMMNSRPAPAKRSDVERTVDVTIVVIFVTLGLMCSVSTILHGLFVETDAAAGSWYLPFVQTQSDLETAESWITFLILFNNLVPISLYVSLEVVKKAQSKFIDWDRDMYYPETQSFAQARTSNLNEDLGQIQYVFSDKTGTLTQNSMEFHQCSVGGIVYGHVHMPDDQIAEEDEDEYTFRVSDDLREESIDSDVEFDNIENKRVSKLAPSRTAADGDTLNNNNNNNNNGQDSGKISSKYAVRGRDGDEAKFNVYSPARDEATRRRLAGKRERQIRKGRIPKTEGLAGYNFADDRFLEDLHSDDDQGDKLRDFLQLLAVCHTVIPEKDKKTGDILYQSSSPDEAALVTAAKYLGYDFYRRGNKFIHVNQLGMDCRYEVLNVNEFNSTRKRMSVVVRTPEGKLMLLCKGADEVMLPLMHLEDGESMQLQSHLFKFATQGLRTLVCARAELDEEFYADWNERYQVAANDIIDRDAKLMKLAKEIERNMTLVGSTAIEDKLQDGVPQAIHKLVRAGIKVWMLTGDKLETAQNIGHSARMLNNTQDIQTVNENSARDTAVAFAHIIRRYRNWIGYTHPDLAIVITGKCLTYVFGSEELRSMFLQICVMAKVVVACRVNPSQKAEIVSTVRYGVTPEPMTLAIGDGANDVAMIQEAHVGIGISGNEGQQAVRSSDYALSQFRFLEKLLLTHGRWNYRRVSFLILYSFYKNIANVLTLFYYCFHNAFSGTTLYESWLGAAWNVGWTLFPVLFFGIFEQDLTKEVALANPMAYVHGQRHSEFNVSRMCLWLWNAFVHSLVIYILSYMSFRDSITSPDGLDTGLFLMGTMINFCTVLTVNYRIALETHFWTMWTFIAFFGSLLLWIIFVFVYSFLISIGYDFFGIQSQIFVRPFFWLLVVLVPVTAMIWDVSYKHIRHAYFPTPLDIVQEQAHMAEEGDDLDFSKKIATEGLQQTFRVPVGGLAGIGISQSNLAGSNMVTKKLSSTSVGGIARAAGAKMRASRVGIDSTDKNQNKKNNKNDNNSNSTASSISAARGGGGGATNNQLGAPVKGALSPVNSNEDMPTLGQLPLKGMSAGQLTSAIAQTPRSMSRRMPPPQAPHSARGPGARGGKLSRQSSMKRMRRGHSANVINPEDEVLVERILHLRNVLSGDQSAILQPKELVESGRRSIFDEPASVRHWLSLSFVNDPELEADFLEQYVHKSVSFVRRAMSVVLVLIMLYAVLAVVQRESNFVLRLIFTAVGGGALGVVYTRLFRQYFYEILTLILLGGGIARTILVEQNGAIGMAMYATISFLVMRSRFIHALWVTTIDVIFYNIYVYRSGLLNTEELIITDFLHLCVMLFTGYVSRQLELAYRIDFLLQQDYRVEQDRTQVILDNMLPRHITKQMKIAEQERLKFKLMNGGLSPRKKDIEMHPMLQSKVIANEEPGVSILFADIMAFSHYVANHPPELLVAILDGVYSTFDELCVKNGVQKMETVGKTYMACAGLQGTRADHAHACAEMAEEMIALMSTCLDSNGDPVGLRIGIHSGRVVSGVVGHKRPQFCLFGDTVNTASRMQSTGAEGQIHISMQTYEFLKDDYRCRMEKVPVKGKGLLTTYFLGERLRRIPKNRTVTIIRNRDDDDDLVKEAMKIIEEATADSVPIIDPYNIPDNDVELDGRKLLFENVIHEREYRNLHAHHAAESSRRPLYVAALASFGEAVLELQLEDPSDNVKFGIVVIRLGFVALLFLVWLMTLAPEHYPQNASMYMTLTFAVGMGTAIGVPASTGDRVLSRRAALIYIFYMTLLSNANVLRFMPNMKFNLASVFVWAIASFAYFSDSEEPEFMLFFVIAAAIVNLVSAYGRELYQRREFVLVSQVKQEKERAERLLYQMLPKSVAEQLKRGKTGIADEYSGVSILYSDIKGFTKYSAKSRPENVVHLLSQLFTEFDHLTDRHSVYKVQTIGDAYVLVGGLPFCAPEQDEVSASDHAVNVVNMAFDMIRVVNSIRTVEGSRIAMRIGVHTGTLIGGCIGTKSLRYDIWGTDGLVSNTLEAEGIPGGVVISAATKWHVDTHFELVPYKDVKVKGRDEPVKTFAVACHLDRPDVRLKTSRDEDDTKSSKKKSPKQKRRSNKRDEDDRKQ